MLGAVLLCVLAQDPAASADAGEVAPTPVVDAADAGVAGPLQIHIHGNVVMPEEVYLSILDLAPDAVADLETAALVREQLISFLHRAGYELAQVHVAIVGGAFEIDIDEGQLEKIVFRGKLTFQTLRFKLALVLPYDVFNRPELDRQVAKLKSELKLEKVWYELIPTEQVQHIGPQIEELPTIQGLQLVHARRLYELHIFFAEHDWDDGTWFDLKSGFPDGTELAAVLQGSKLIFADDRYRVSGSGGLNLRQSIVEKDYYVAPSRAAGDIRYYFPYVGHGLGRPFVSLLFEGTERQRPDLCFENYDHERAEATLNLQYQPGSRMTISYGGGTQWRRIFAEDPPPLDANVTSQPCGGAAHGLPLKGLRTFGMVRTDLIFDTNAVRFDRRHALWAEARYYIGPRDPIDNHRPTYGELRGAYQNVWAFGWHDLWLRARGAWLWGDVYFHDEEPMGAHTPGVFGDEYVHHAASVWSEFRFSITRDLYKIGLFSSLATYGHLDQRSCPAGVTAEGNLNQAITPCFSSTPATRSFASTAYETPVFATAFGGGFHALVEGMIQIDIYYSLGLRTGHSLQPSGLPPSIAAQFETGAWLNLEKVF